MMAHHTILAVLPTQDAPGAHTLLVGIAVAIGVSLLAAWVAALSAPDQAAEPSTLDQWDNGRAHYVGANCCGAEVVSTVHGWTLCAEHGRAA